MMKHDEAHIVSRKVEILLSDCNWNAARATIDRAEREYNATGNQRPLSETEKLQLPITALDVDARTANALDKSGVHTIGDLLNRTREQLSAIRNFGPVQLESTIAALDKIGFQSNRPARTCPGCGKKIASLNTTRMFCSRPCFVQSLSNRPASTRVGSNGR